MADNQSEFAKAVHTVAEHLRRSHLFVHDGPALMTPAQRAAREHEIKLCADQMDASKTYAEFEAALHDAYKLGIIPYNDDVGRVADASMLLPK